MSTITEDDFERLKRDLATYKEALAASQLEAAKAKMQVTSLLKTKTDLEGKNSTLEKHAIISNKLIGDLSGQVKRLKEQASRESDKIVDLEAEIRKWENKRWYDFF